MKGEQDLIAAMGRPDGQMEPTPGSLFAARPWKRMMISAAGPLVNLATAVVVFVGLALVGTPSMGPASRILLAADVDGRTGTAAEAAGLKSGDRVLAVGGHELKSFAELQAAIVNSQTQAMTWSIDRDGARSEVRVTPQWDPVAKRPVVGVYPFNPPVIRTVVPKSVGSLAGFRSGDRIVSVDGQPIVADQVFFARVGKGLNPSYQVVVDRSGAATSLTLVSEGPKSPLGLAFDVPVYPAKGLSPPDAVVSGAQKTWGLLGQMIDGLARLFTGKEDPVQSLSGPIGIVGQGTEAVASAFSVGLDFGVATFVQLLAFLSLALFLMNLLPIPALDGGSIVISLFEALRQRRLGIRALMVYQQVGVVLVLGLLLFTTLNDLGLFGKT
jgi:regulator of sigma E protease